MKSATILGRLESAAVGQRGLITTTQAQREGVERVQLKRLEGAAVIARVRRGVYALPSAEPSALLEVRAAWLHLDPTRFAEERLFDDQKIVISHTSAANVHGLGVMIPNRHEFTTNYRKQSTQDDIQIRRGAFGDDDTAIVEGMLVTSITRTVSDLARSRIEFGYLADVVSDALSRPEIRVTDVVRVLDRWAERYEFSSGGAMLEACRAHAGEVHDQAEQLARLSPAAREQLSKQISAAIAPTVQLQVQKILDAQLAGRTPQLSVQSALENTTRHQQKLVRDALQVASAGLTIPAGVATPPVLPKGLSEALGKVWESNSTNLAIAKSMEATTRQISSPVIPQDGDSATANDGTDRAVENEDELRRHSE